MVPGRGLEPPRLASLTPEASASTNSATRAKGASLRRAQGRERYWPWARLSIRCPPMNRVRRSLDQIERLDSVRWAMAAKEIEQGLRRIAADHRVAGAEIFDGARHDDQHDQRRVADRAPGVRVAGRFVDIAARADHFAA